MSEPARITQGVLPIIARVAICLIFIQGAMGKMLGWSGQAEYMASHGISPVAPLLGAALVIEAAGVLCLLIGFQTRIVALVMAIYLCIVSALLHNFWSPNSGMFAQTEFFKNIAIVGGLLMISAFGPGRFSLEGYLERKRGAAASA